MRALTLALLALAGCRQPDRLIVSPDGRFTAALYQPAQRAAQMPKTLSFAGWAELYGRFGLSCGRGSSAYNRQPTGVVHWGPDVVTVDGVEGFWTLNPCRYVAPPPSKLY